MSGATPGGRTPTATALRTIKENTDDLRESPVVTLLETLIGKGRELRVYDPHIQLATIYGSNRNFLLSSIPHIGRLMVGSLEELCAWATHVVVAQKPGQGIRESLAGYGKPTLNLVE